METVKSDPHGIIPDGFSIPGQYTVYGYCNPAGSEPLALMACLIYPDCPATPYSTTRGYISILQDYLKQVDTMELLERQDIWRKKKRLEFIKDHPELADWNNELEGNN